MASIYIIENSINGNIYVGQSEQPQKRLRAHRYLLKSGQHPNAHLNSAWGLYGEDVFRFSIEVEDLTAEEADLEEVRLISYYRSLDRSYNLDAGGKQGYTHSTETKDKIREGHKGKPKGPMSEDHKSSISRTHKERPMTEERVNQWDEARRKRGPITEETRQKMRDSHLGKTISEEQKKKIGESLRTSEKAQEARRKVTASNIGRIHTEKARANISAGLKGRTFSEERKEAIRQSHLGKPLSEEHRRKIGDANRGKPKPEVTESHRNKIGNANRGKVRSEEERARRSQTLKAFYQTPEGKACLAARLEKRRAKKQIST